MLTVEHAREYLSGIGIELPEFLLEAFVARINTIWDCLDANYDAATALLIQCYLLGLFGLAQGDRYIASQSAPNGASRSFRYLPFAERWAGLLALLRSLDTQGCAKDLIPPDPTRTAYGFLGVAQGGCHG